MADALAAVVESGTTRRRAGLEIFGDAILESEAVLVQRRDFAGSTTFDHFMRRYAAVQRARSSVQVDNPVPSEALDAATALPPGLEAPTVSPLSKDGWYAVRAMVPRTVVQGLMDQLWDAGARAILSTELSACRL